jgi:hypothetical protein
MKIGFKIPLEPAGGDECVFSEYYNIKTSYQDANGK